jgi:putative tricarboxylic transport membrane protein
MRTGETLAATFWLAVAVGVTVAGYRLGLGSLGDPGSGFMIFWVGTVMVALSLAALATAARQSAADGLLALWRGTRWYLVPYVTLLLVLYAWSLPALGFLAAASLLLFVLFKTVEPIGWGLAVLLAILSTAAAYIVFHRWLGTQLPAGQLPELWASWIY